MCTPRRYVLATTRRHDPTEHSLHLPRARVSAAASSSPPCTGTQDSVRHSARKQDAATCNDDQTEQPNAQPVGLASGLGAPGRSSARPLAAIKSSTSQSPNRRLSVGTAEQSSRLSDRSRCTAPLHAVNPHGTIRSSRNDCPPRPIGLRALDAGAQCHLNSSARLNTARLSASCQFDGTGPTTSPLGNSSSCLLPTRSARSASQMTGARRAPASITATRPAAYVVSCAAIAIRDWAGSGTILTSCVRLSRIWRLIVRDREVSVWRSR